MIELVYCPSWFYGRDIVIDIISVFVLMLVFFFLVKYYIMSKNRKYIYLGLAFLTMANSFIFKILMNFTIYNEIVETRTVGFATLTYEKIISSDNLFFIGFLMYRITMLLGLYLLYNIYRKETPEQMFFASVLIILTIYFSSSSYYIFHLLQFMLLFMISVQYFKIYKKNRLVNTKYLAYSFSMITLSQISSIFIKTNELIYVIAEIVQLIGYISLLITFSLVLRNGKKKIKA